MIVFIRRRVAVLVLFLLALAVVAAICVFTGDKPTLADTLLPESEVIVLDAGHGGEDGGAVSADGVPESTINLEIAKKLQLLFAFLGTQTRMTREGEDAVYSDDAQTIREKKVSDLKNRVQLVNDTAGGFLISIHQNSLQGSKSVSGAQVFYNETDTAKQTAEAVQAALNLAINPGNEKAAKQIDSSIYLMKNITKPGILVESGFMSNAAEAALLQTETHQMRIAAAVAAGYLKGLAEREST